jgi:hypothetical protein
MRDESDDRTTGLKKWYLAVLPAIAAIAAIPGAMTHGPARLDAWLAGLGGLFLFLLFAAFVLAGDAWEASPRVELRWQQSKVHWVTRIMGPGLVQTLMLVLVSGLLSTAMFSLVGAAALSYPAEPGLPPAPAVALLLCGETWGAFFVFMVGFLLWARSRSRSAATARIVLLLVSGTAVAAPWLTSLAVHYGSERGFLDTFILSSPSPLYALVVVSAILRGEPHLPMVSSIACSLGWVLLGVLMFGLGARRATRIVAMRRKARASLAAMVFAALLGGLLATSCVHRSAPCSSPGSCGAGLICSAGRCTHPGVDPVASDSDRIVVAASDIAVVSSRGAAVPDEIALAGGSAPVVLLRFPAPWGNRARISAAFLTLEVQDDSGTGGPWTMSVARVLEPWSAGAVSWGRLPRLSAPVVTAELTPWPSRSLRIDVTPIVERWAQGQADEHGMALWVRSAATRGPTYATGALGAAGPRLDVYVR